MSDYNLADTIIETMQSMVEQTVHLTQTFELDDASSILSEWTLDDECVLTKYLQDDTETIKGYLLYMSLTEKQIGYGSFTFDPDAELPVDNN